MNRKKSRQSKQNEIQNFIDLREEHLLDIHRFFRGEKSNEQEFSDYISRREIEDFKQKYDIYKHVCAKIKEDLYSTMGNRDSKNLNSILKGKRVQTDEGLTLTMKAAVYLNQALGQSNSLERKKMLQELANKMHLII